MDVLFIEVATFLPNLVEIGQNLRERIQFFKIQDGGCRQLEFRSPGLYHYHRCVVSQSRYVPTKFG